MHGGATLAKSFKPSSGTRCRSPEVFTVLGRSRQDAGAQAKDAGRGALANRMARIVWALMTNKDIYRVSAAA